MAVGRDLAIDRRFEEEERREEPEDRHEDAPGPPAGQQIIDGAVGGENAPVGRHDLYGAPTLIDRQPKGGEFGLIQPLKRGHPELWGAWTEPSGRRQADSAVAIVDYHWLPPPAHL